MADGVRPRRVSTVWINARPTRPFPSVKGWIVSNWAWTMPTWTRGACTEPLRYSTRSSISSGTSSGGGGTKSADSGCQLEPPIQFCTRRSPWCSSSGSSAAWSCSTSATVTASAAARASPALRRTVMLLAPVAPGPRSRGRPRPGRVRPTPPVAVTARCPRSASARSPPSAGGIGAVLRAPVHPVRSPGSGLRARPPSRGD